MIGRIVAGTYVLTVTTIAAFGFATDTTGAILLAGALALPFSLPAIACFYAVFGLLAQVPGANPDSASGSTYCTADGACTTSDGGDAASWFLFTTDVIGVLALTAAALLNVVVIRRLLTGRRPAPVSNRPGGRA